MNHRYHLLLATIYPFSVLAIITIHTFTGERGILWFTTGVSIGSKGYWLFETCGESDSSSYVPQKGIATHLPVLLIMCSGEVLLLSLHLTKVAVVYEDKKAFLKRIYSSMTTLNKHVIPGNEQVPYADVVLDCASVLANMGVTSTWVSRHSIQRVIKKLPLPSAVTVANPDIVPPRVTQSPRRPVLTDSDHDIDDVQQRSYSRKRRSAHRDAIAENDRGTIDIQQQSYSRKRRGSIIPTNSNLALEKANTSTSPYQHEQCSLTSLIFELSGNVSLAKRVLDGDYDAIQQAYHLRWSSAEDEILQVLVLHTICTLEVSAVSSNTYPGSETNTRSVMSSAPHLSHTTRGYNNKNKTLLNGRCSSVCSRKKLRSNGCTVFNISIHTLVVSSYSPSKVLQILFLTLLPQLTEFTLVSCVRATVTIVMLAIQSSCTIVLWYNEGDLTKPMARG